MFRDGLGPGNAEGVPDAPMPDEPDDEEEGGAGPAGPVANPQLDRAFDREAQRARDERGIRPGYEPAVYQSLQMAQWERMGVVNAARRAQMLVNGFIASDARWQRDEIRQLARDSMRHREEQLNNAMGKIRFGHGTKDLTLLSAALANRPELRTAEGRGTEADRREHFQDAVQAHRDGTIALREANSIVCAYDIVLFAAGNADLDQYYLETAQLRIAQKRFFSGRRVCMYMDTGLLCIDHSVYLADTAARQRMHSYAAFFHMTQPYVGVDTYREKKATDFIYGDMLKLKNVLTANPIDSLQAGNNRRTKAQREAHENAGGNRARYIRDGDHRGRVAISNHFAILEQMLMHRYCPVAAEVVQMRQEYTDVGVPTNANVQIAAILEENGVNFGGMLCTEYVALIYRIVTGDAGYGDAGRDAGIFLPKIPTYARAAPAAGDGSRTFKKFQEAAGAWPARGRRLNTDAARYKFGLAYIRRIVYTACRYLWFPHKLVFVHLFNALQYSSIANNFAIDRSLLVHADGNYDDAVKNMDDAGDDMADHVIHDHRTVAYQMHNGTVEALQYAMTRRQDNEWRRRRAARGAAGAAGDQMLPGQDPDVVQRGRELVYNLVWNGDYQWAPRRVLDDAWAYFTIDHMYDYKDTLAWRTGRLTVYVAGVGMVCWAASPMLFKARDLYYKAQAAKALAVEAAEFAAEFGAARHQAGMETVYRMADNARRFAEAPALEAGRTFRGGLWGGIGAVRHAGGYAADFYRGVTGTDAPYGTEPAPALPAPPPLPAELIISPDTRTYVIEDGTADEGPRLVPKEEARGATGGFWDWFRSQTPQEIDEVVTDGFRRNNVPMPGDDGSAFGYEQPTPASTVSLSNEAEAIAGGSVARIKEDQAAAEADRSETLPNAIEVEPASPPPKGVPPERTASDPGPRRRRIRGFNEVRALYGDMTTLRQTMDTTSSPEVYLALQEMLGTDERPAARDTGKRRLSTGLVAEDEHEVFRRALFQGLEQGPGGPVEQTAIDLSRMSFATGELTAPASSVSFWEYGHNLAFRM